MLTPENLRARAKMACASDIPAILNRSPFRDANRDCTMIKKLRTFREPDYLPETSDAMMRGNYLEESVACLTLHREMGDLYQPLQPRLALPAECFAYGNTMTHKDYPQYGATLDFLVATDGAIRPFLPIEIKTAAKADGWSNGDIPEHVWIQVQWQLFVFRSRYPEVDKSLIGALVCSDPIQRWCGYDEGFIASIRPSVDRFLADLASHIVNGTAPETPPDVERVELPITQTLRQATEELAQVRSELARLERREKHLMATILDDIPRGVFGTYRTGGFTVSVCKRDRKPKPSAGDIAAATRALLVQKGVPEGEIQAAINAVKPREVLETARYLYMRKGKVDT